MDAVAVAAGIGLAPARRVRPGAPVRRIPVACCRPFDVMVSTDCVERIPVRRMRLFLHEGRDEPEATWSTRCRCCRGREISLGHIVDDEAGIVRTTFTFAYLIADSCPRPHRCPS